MYVMSQSRVRKAPGGSDTNKKREAVASADINPNPQSRESRRRKKDDKVPRSIRYELENALVGLCDVWFEEIKPHLVRNNIKLHVGGNAGGSRAAGDHVASAQPRAQAEDCSHLDPGAASDRLVRGDANCAGSCATRRLVLRAPCRKPKPALPHQPAPLPPPPAPLSPPTIRRMMCQNNEVTRKPKNPYHKEAKLLSNLTVPNCRVPRLCTSYFRINHQKITKRIPTTWKSSTKFIKPSQETVKTLNRFTQTDKLPTEKVSIRAGAKNKGQEISYSKCITDVTLPISLESKVKGRKHLLDRPRISSPLSKPLSPHGKCRFQTNRDKCTSQPKTGLETISIAQRSPLPRVARNGQQIKESSPPISASPRCRIEPNTKPNSPANQTTAFHPPKIVTRNKIAKAPKRKPNGRNASSDSLFDSDLIDIIGQVNDKRLETYKNPKDSSSIIMNLRDQTLLPRYTKASSRR